MALRELFSTVVPGAGEPSSSSKDTPIKQAFKKGMSLVDDPKEGDVVEQSKLDTKKILKMRRDRVEVDQRDEEGDGEEGFSSLKDVFKSKMRGDDQEEAAPAKKKKKAAPADPSVKITVPTSDEKKKKDGEESKEKQDDDGEEEDKREKAGKKTEDKKDGSKDEPESGEITSEETEELLGVDVDKLVSASGQTISKRASENIRKLKSHLKHYAEKAKALEEAANKSKTIEKESAELREAHKALKQKFNDLYFEESDDFIETYVTPLKTAESSMVKWLSSHDIGDEAEAKEILGPLITQIQKSLSSGDEVKYYEAVDAAAEHLKPGSSARFRASAPTLWDAYSKKAEAIKDKEKAREAIKKTSLTFAQQQAKESDKVIDTLLSDFEKSNEKIIRAYKEDDRYKDYIDYDNTVVAKIKDAKLAIATAVQQRKVTDDLVKLAFAGAMSGLRDKEHQGFLARIASLEDEIATLEEKVKSKDSAISKFKPSSAARSVTEDEDEGDGEDGPSSMVEVFRKRYKR